MRKIVNIIVCLHLSYFSLASKIEGIVLSNNKPVEFAHVFLKGTSIGGTTNTNGYYEINDVEKGTYLIVVSAMDYYVDSLRITIVENEKKTFNFTLRESVKNINEVTITATMKEISVSDSPIAIDIITPKLFERNPNPNIFESLNMVNGVRPQLQCNVCNTGDIHINGMEGPYSMVMIDGMPIVSALGTVYGLMGIPNSIIQRVKIQKGPSSTLYGSEAVGGLINVITKSPEKAPFVSFDIFGTSYQELNTDVSIKYKIGKNITALSSVNYFHFDKKWDINNDNFTDVTLQKRSAFFNKFSYKHKSGKSSQLAIRYYYEDRWGGELQWNKSFRGGDSIYGESIYTNRYEVIGVSPFKLFKQDFKLQYSYNKHLQNSAYGKTPFYANQNIIFGQITKNINLNRNDILIGIALRYTNYDDNTVITQSKDSVPSNKPLNTYLPGLFIQDEIGLNENNILLLGIRYDYNSIHGSIFSPRVNWKYTINKNNTLRVGIGNGYRVVNLFSEDHAAFNGARDVVIVSDLKPEQSWNSTLNYSVFKQFKKSFVSIDANLFYTYFTNKIVADYFTDHQKVIFDNLNGFGINRGIGAHLLWSFQFPLKLSIGATFVDVFLQKMDSLNNYNKTVQVQTPKFTSNFVVSYNFNKWKTSVDLTGNIYSSMLLPILPNDYRPEYSPWFCLMNLQMTKEFKKDWQLYMGCKNILNFIPKEAPIMRAFDPFDKYANDPVSNPNGYTFDPGYNYAPFQKARLFLGVRFKIKEIKK
ncbi:MAG: TonB-dependent receptor [Flavobacteriia bacterium]|nr:TonB-dependent receptor [Flavobacteriia bacterium]